MDLDNTSIDLEQLLNPNVLAKASNLASDNHVQHILSTCADVIAKIKEHEMLHTVHYIVAFKRTMEDNIDGLHSVVATDHYCKKNKIVLQDTKKFDCPAKAVIKEIVEFPQYKLDRDSVWLRQEASKKLRAGLATKENNSICRKYILLLPEISAHKNHPTGDEAGLNQPLSKEIITKIGQLVAKGVKSVSEMRRLLDSFVSTKFNSIELPQKTNKRFFPRDETIANHMQKARLTLRRSMIDQECLRDKINEWAMYYPDAKMQFRPKGAISSDKDLKLQNSLLFIYQDKWQQKLLYRYGNKLAFLDTTYRTTKYALPLFFLVVKTNIDYQIVAIFVCENKTTEALMCNKKWNPLFQPKFFMTDYSNEEINLLETVLPGCQVFICDFHREQAWERWLSKSTNGCSYVKDQVKKMLRKIAHSKTEEICKKLVQELEEWPEWKKYPKLAEYLTNTYLSKR
ncbi:uncharacterized protein LOC136078917 [Hydra vulgaris]|uniref:Uncharacterized protein LOC136078917 n=1 Tax=Hydra vulgaris TaxID=6087 RepID=A0ABM4BNV7_HYDVU